MFMEDLSAYRYHHCDGLPGVLPIGWLSAGHSFATGHVPRSILDTLVQLAVFKSINFMRGMHRCEFCQQEEIVAEFEGVVRMLGCAEVWVPGEGVLYAAPNLIVHYIGVHRYKPPEQFVRA